MVGFRPELWEHVAPGEAPPDAAGFDEPIPGPGGFAMPATQHDAWVWLAGGNRSAVFDNARAVVGDLRDGLTPWLTPLSGSYYTVPSVEALARFAPEDDEDRRRRPGLAGLSPCRSGGAATVPPCR